MAGHVDIHAHGGELSLEMALEVGSPEFQSEPERLEALSDLGILLAVDAGRTPKPLPPVCP